MGIQKGCFGVGLNIRVFSSFFFLTFLPLLNAAPMLRLVTSAVGPIAVPSGGSAPAQTVEAYNIGDGSLSLTVSVPPSAGWLTASVGASRTCASTTAAANCLPIQFTLNTSGLAAGTYTGTATVSGDSSTVDAPQTITVTNTSSVAVSITSVALTGANPSDFSEVTTCGTSLAAGGTCTVVVLFTPLTSGTLSASLALTDSAAGSPQTVSLSGGGSHDVIITWTASATSKVSGYYVYRGTASGKESTTPLNSSPIAGTSYADSNVTAGQTYYYVVTTVGSNGTTQSVGSTETSATVP